MPVKKGGADILVCNCIWGRSLVASYEQNPRIKSPFAKGVVRERRGMFPASTTPPAFPATICVQMRNPTRFHCPAIRLDDGISSVWGRHSCLPFGQRTT